MNASEKLFNYQEYTEWVHEAARLYPRYVQLSSLGKSYEGRELWLLTVTDWETGSDRERSALWVDGNLHASELSGTNACLHLLLHLVTEQPRLLQEVAFYLVPRVCPDGAERALAGDPEFLRSSTRPYPYPDPIGSGVSPADVDGNGKILWMRLPDPRGPWKRAAEDGRLMVRRQPEDREGPFYRILPEGRWIGDFDPWKPAVAPRRQNLDLNRNFPIRWRPEHQQAGAGPFPASEAETQACVRFLSDHPNVVQAVTFHTFSGVILRPSSLDCDDALHPADLKLFKYFGEKGSEWTGYPLLSVFHDFRYNAKELITGTFDDWVYDSLGAFAWTVEIWSVMRKAGFTKGFDRDTPRGQHRFISWFESHPIEEEVQLLKWCDAELGGRGFEEWQPFTHPQLGEVEIGGWDMVYLFRNPPPEFLQAELEPLTRWVTWMAHANPRLELAHQEVEALAPGLYRLRLVIDNAGWLPTYGSKKGLERQVTRGVMVRLYGDHDQVELVTGEWEQQLGQLEGISSRPEAPFWHRGDGCDSRLVVEWTVRAADALPALRWEVRHERAGLVRGEFR